MIQTERSLSTQKANNTNSCQFYMWEQVTRSSNRVAVIFRQESRRISFNGKIKLCWNAYRVPANISLAIMEQRSQPASLKAVISLTATSFNSTNSIRKLKRIEDCKDISCEDTMDNMESEQFHRF